MSITLSNIITNLNTYLGDTSNDRISAAERYEALTEATVWLQEELGNEHMVETYSLDFYDTVNYYKVTTQLADLLVGADLRRDEGLQTQEFARKSPREIAQEISSHVVDPSWAIERRDGDAYLVINYESPYTSTIISSFDYENEGGTWTADTSASDALNVTYQSNLQKHGPGALNFDIDVSQSGNNNAVIYAPDSPSKDLSSLEDIGSFLLWVYVPENTYTSSVTLTWGDDTAATPATKSNYWTATASTDVNGNAIADGWNLMKFDWSSSTLTGTPDSSAIVYYEIKVNYTASQTDDTDYRLDYLRIVQPETLTFHYVSWNVGTTNAGSAITAFTATNDVPFFSGRYDQYKYAVAHKAASILFYSALRLQEAGATEEAEAIKALRRYRKQFESQVTRESKSFKPFGVNLRNRIRRSPRFR